MDSKALLPPQKIELGPALESIGTQKESTQLSTYEGSCPFSSRNIPMANQDRITSSGSEDNPTFISESMTVTSADEEKLLLLNKNTDLRRLNKDLVKLNQEWDHIYRTTTLGMQQRIGSLQQEVENLKQHAERLTLKLDHEQNKREYFEQTLVQELKKNQNLQEYVRHLENKLHGNPDRKKVESCYPPWTGEFSETPFQSPRVSFKLMPSVESEMVHKSEGSSLPISPKPRHSKQANNKSFENNSDVKAEVQELKAQLEALKCQTKIYETDYKTEHKDRERIQAENEKLRKKAEEMRQQMHLLHEQLKIYEDDFRKERSDKQVLQRLLKRNSGTKEAVLVHRCNNDHEKPVAATSAPAQRKGSISKQSEHQCHKQLECSKHPLRKDVHVQATSFSIDYK
ncbi:TNFAIP3-interacting protein 3-like [Protopterus annectens]|uniref:TNFAIP3-interacting protein 3-like n=1 Tax=Protopterus annectens TaxID=7888 RepID=UPI001CF97FA4|nr:TNFAIP3-interacting protein 3-like [Protopterus annectens]